VYEVFQDFKEIKVKPV